MPASHAVKKPITLYHASRHPHDILTPQAGKGTRAGGDPKGIYFFDDFEKANRWGFTFLGDNFYIEEVKPDPAKIISVEINKSDNDEKKIEKIHKQKRDGVLLIKRHANDIHMYEHIMLDPIHVNRIIKVETDNPGNRKLHHERNTID